MPLNLDLEILHDFLIEAGEILESLSEQLVELEARSDDTELLNAIFRGFHTVKGGAGFLAVAPLVEICHSAENTFDLLRKGQLKVEPALMDVILQSLDEVNRMMQDLRNEIMPSPAPEILIASLKAIVDGTFVSKSAKAPVADTPTTPAIVAVPQQTETPSPDALTPPVEANTGSDLITDEEFDKLLDALQGVPLPKQNDAPVSKAEPKLDTHTDETGHLGSGPKSAGKAPEADKSHGAAKEVDTTVRVDTARLDEIMNMVGELVLVRNRLVKIKDNIHEEELAKAVGHLDLVTADLQMSVMKTRMQPIKKVFGRFPRVVRDLARSLKKEINLVMHGEDTDLDKNLVEALSDPLVHLVRNSVDHGIEEPSDRLNKNKKAMGQITLSAAQAGDHIMLSIQDDGRGMDPEVLRRKAVEKGVIDAEVANRLSKKECFDIIFIPGFSTKEQITDISGRGVGMDVVKTKITQLNGLVDIESEPNVGTRITIKVPLTLAILPTLMIRVGEQIFALPLTNVDEIFQFHLSKTNVVDGQRVVVVRDKPIPLFHLQDWLFHERVLASGKTEAFDKNTLAHVVIVAIGIQRVAFVVDGLIGQEEVVIKALGSTLQGTPGMAGATITGDGKIAMILDVNGLLQRYVRN